MVQLSHQRAGHGRQSFTTVITQRSQAFQGAGQLFLRRAFAALDQINDGRLGVQTGKPLREERHFLG